jgi:hypothetical protein
LGAISNPVPITKPTDMKKSYTFKLEPELIEKLRKMAEKDNRSFNNYVETILLDHSKKAKK